MKVKVGQLKAHLSKYLREVQETGEPIEVCVREKPVAYLTPISDVAADELQERKVLEEKLKLRGIKVVQWGQNRGPLPKPGKPGDGKTIENTIVAMREEKDW
jgi:prevent-host-death family protein